MAGQMADRGVSENDELWLHTEAAVTVSPECLSVWPATNSTVYHWYAAGPVQSRRQVDSCYTAMYGA